LLGDDRRDRELQRNQLLAIVLMTVLVVGWSYFFLPTTPRPTETPAEPGIAVQGEGLPSPSPEMRDGATEARSAIAGEPGATDASTGLPPSVAGTVDPRDHLIHVSDGILELSFTKLGARLTNANLILGQDGVNSLDLVPQPFDPADGHANYPLGLYITGSGAPWADALNSRLWEGALTPDGRGARFSIEIEGHGRVEKVFRLADREHVLTTEVTYTNLSESAQILGVDTAQAGISLLWEPNVASGDLTKGVNQEILWHRGGSNEHLYTSKLEPPKPGSAYSRRELGADFAGIKSAYFLVAMRPVYEGADFWVRGNPNAFVFGVGAPRVELAPGLSHTREFEVYLGPTQMQALQAAWPGLDSVLEFFTWFGILDWFAKLLLSILNWFHGNVIANYGLAIIFLTFVVRLVLLPLTWKSMKSMKKMQKLAPEMEAIRKELGDDNPQELNKRMWALYQERGVNPLGGCFPLLLQMPIFIALYRMLWSAFELRGAPFFGWITDLSEPDRFYRFPFEIPVFFTTIDAFNLLPIIMGITMWISTKIMPTGPVQNQQQKIIMTLMPIMLTVFCYNLASGLSLYILTSTLLGIGQNYLIQVSDSDLEVKHKPKTARKPLHPYNAMQAKKREIAKEARREKRAKITKGDPKPKAGKKKRS